MWILGVKERGRTYYWKLLAWTLLRKPKSFPLSVTLPARMIPHLTIGGLVEALVTGGVIAFLGKHHPELFDNTRRREETR